MKKSLIVAAMVGLSMIPGQVQARDATPTQIDAADENCPYDNMSKRKLEKQVDADFEQQKMIIGAIILYTEQHDRAMLRVSLEELEKFDITRMIHAGVLFCRNIYVKRHFGQNVYY